MGPKAILLRTEDAGLDARIDELHSEKQVRQLLEDFNARVIDARRQLMGGPPVVTRTRDVESEVRSWQERRAALAAADRKDAGQAAEQSAGRGKGRETGRTRRPWWRRIRPGS